METTKDVEIYNSFEHKRTKIRGSTEQDCILLYICGPTLYGPVHIGNLRPLIIADLIVRFFKKNKIKYEYMQSLTDISDKIDNVSRSLNCSEEEVVEKFEAEYRKILHLMQFVEADHYAKPSQHINAIGRFITDLIAKKTAYVVKKNVFFRIKTDPLYGALSRKDIKKNITKSNYWSSLKEDERDFSLWKPRRDKHQTLYNAPKIGVGRPGWHIECSVMAATLFVKHNRTNVDFCIGGQDLLFPHNENMLAQHRALFQNNFARCWINVGQVQLNQKKMAKSTKNFLLAQKYLTKHSADSLRYLLLKTSHQKPLNVNPSLITEAEKKVAQWKNAANTTYFSKWQSPNYISPTYTKMVADNLNTIAIFKQLNNDFKIFNKFSNKHLKQQNLVQIINELNYAFYLLGFSFVNK